MKLQHDRLERVLKNQNIKIANPYGFEDVIAAYAFEDGDKPFIYIKLSWRDYKEQITKQLLRALEENNEQR
jgi:hypothetical protein